MPMPEEKQCRRALMTDVIALDSDCVSPDSIRAAVEVGIDQIMTVAEKTGMHPNWNEFRAVLIDNGRGETRVTITTGVLDD